MLRREVVDEAWTRRSDWLGRWSPGHARGRTEVRKRRKEEQEEAAEDRKSDRPKTFGIVKALRSKEPKKSEVTFQQSVAPLS